jgi:hypothetical protein
MLAHVGLPLTNDGLRTVERSSYHVILYLSPQRGSDMAIFSRKGRTGRKPPIGVGRGGNGLAGVGQREAVSQGSDEVGAANDGPSWLVTGHA